MESFEFLSVGRIVFERGGFARIGELAAGLGGGAAMLVTNAGQAGDGGIVDRLAELLKAANLRCATWRQRGEPTVDDVASALGTAREEECDVVIGLGGGSAIDAAKAVAGLLTNGGGPLDYMEVVGKGRKITRQAAPWIAVPTTAGTGAEVTSNAVISSPENHFKASIRGEQLLARVVAVDAELGVGVRPEVTAWAGMDALCQLVESYTSARARPMTDALAVEGLARTATALPRAYADGTDVEAREEMAFAAMLGGITLANAGLGAAHGFASPMGANFPIPHGVVCGALLPHVMRANVHALRQTNPQSYTLYRYAVVGRMLTGRADLRDDEVTDAGIRFVEDLAAKLEIPPLAHFGLTEEAFGNLIALARKSSSMRYNPVELSDRALTDVLRRAM